MTTNFQLGNWVGCTLGKKKYVIQHIIWYFINEISKQNYKIIIILKHSQ